MSASRAPQSCQQCRRLKRKCTRELPFCSLCIRLGKACQYTQRSPHSASENAGSIGTSIDSPEAGGALLLARVQRLEGALLSGPSLSSLGSPGQVGHFGNGPGSRSSAASSAGDATPVGPGFGNPNKFPSEYFLDPDFFTPLSADALSLGTPPILSSCLLFLGMDLMPICHTYIATVSRSLSILSPKRLLQDISAIRPSHPDPGFILVLCGIRLLSDTAYAGACAEYKLAKALSSSAENEGIVSLRLIQGLVLLAVYELGHGLCPASYMTIGRAARMAMLMGLHDRQGAPQLFKPADTWTAREEERRAWWAIFTLDRFCNINTESLPLAVPEPSKTFLLPINDLGWSQGDMGTAVPEPAALVSSLTVSDSSAIGRFATTCQAAHLVSHVLQHRASARAAARDVTPPPADDTLRIDEALQLHRTLVALDSRIALGDAPGHDANMEALALVCVARMALYNLYGCNEPDVRSAPGRLRAEAEMQRVSVQGVVEVGSGRAAGLARGSPAGGRAVSPFVLACLYLAATECAWFVREGCGPDMRASLVAVVQALRVLRGSWGAAGTFLELLARDETVAEMFGDVS
ncbi:hypothetical protein B0H67DRAFT_518827 [Lasiosphaeris hirsuta]|uniref:Zn(2)-C6 fungal-type domain-containing protein n=1 Tax=Lasiosphaeris hirsuta TaxID=260670 RepID=A0AA40AA76_9PEZI|nr:hypothetical protein B0H67DRAFT_518827 [Lasiosphaeris hirsuta]